MKYFIIIFAATLFVATVQAQKIPHLECDIGDSTYTKHNGEVVQVPPITFRIKHDKDVKSSLFIPSELEKLPHAWVHSVAFDGKRFEKERAGITASTSLSWRYEMKPEKIILYNEYEYMAGSDNYLTRAMKIMVVKRTNGEVIVFDYEGYINTKGQCKTVEVMF